MLRKVILLLPVCAGFLSGCVTTPPLSQATGAEDSAIMIKDVVQRVKCELSEAFDRKTEEPGLEWLAMWTAHVDLALAINDNAGLSPNGSFIDYRRSAVNFDAGPSTFPATAARSVMQQFLTVSAGIALNGQAVRTETISFTVSLEELKEWRRGLEREQSSLPPEARTCNFPPSTGLTGNLGLKEWADSAFFPAQTGDLTPGLHKAEWQDFQIPSVQGLDYYAYLEDRLKKLRFGTATLEGPQRPLSPHGWKGGTGEDDLAKIKSVQAATKEAMSTISSASDKIRSNTLAVSSRLDTIKRYDSVIRPSLAERYNRAIKELMAAITRSGKCIKYKDDLDLAFYYYYKSDNKWPPKDSPSTPWQSVTPPSGSGPGGLYSPGLPNAGPPLDGQMPGQPLPQAPGSAPPLSGPWGPPPAVPSYDQMQQGQSPQSSSNRAKMHPKFQEKLDKLRDFSFYANVMECAKDLPKLAELVTTFISTFPNQVDPPIDSVLHSLQFVIVNGASVTPSWTLLQWRGPGQSGSFAAANSVRTHNLQLALGPRTGQAPISQDATRLIQNQTVKSLANSGGGG